MVKDHSDSGRGNLLPPHRLLFLISSKGSFTPVTPVVEHWLEREISTNMAAKNVICLVHMQGHYLGEIAPMASAEIAPLSKHDTQYFYYYYLCQEDYDFTGVFWSLGNFSSIGQDKSKLQKQIIKLLFLIETVASLKSKHIYIQNSFSDVIICRLYCIMSQQN